MVLYANKNCEENKFVKIIDPIVDFLHDAILQPQIHPL